MLATEPVELPFPYKRRKCAPIVKIYFRSAFYFTAFNEFCYMLATVFAKPYLTACLVVISGDIKGCLLVILSLNHGFSTPQTSHFGLGWGVVWLFFQFLLEGDFA